MRLCFKLLCLIDKDPGPQFRNDETQSLLKSITRLDINKIYRKRSVPNRTDYKYDPTNIH